MFTTTAHADNPNAEALFYQAKSLMAQRKFVEVCAAFEASKKLKPAPATLVSLADCRERSKPSAPPGPREQAITSISVVRAAGDSSR